MKLMYRLLPMCGRHLVDLLYTGNIHCVLYVEGSSLLLKYIAKGFCIKLILTQPCN